MRYVHEALDVQHPLTTEQFKTNGVDLFVERLGKIINASREGQLGMKAVLRGSLDRIEYDDEGRAVRLFPVLRRADMAKTIVIDPRRAFGRPVIAGTSAPVAAVRAWFDAGEGVKELARFRCSPGPHRGRAPCGAAGCVSHSSTSSTNAPPGTTPSLINMYRQS